ncbi:outer membrane protein transport protein [Flavobacterium sp. SUN046]|uniref:OmpP1/FadL family transporter n=1 Tax=Flavobacterium sp. SUN046 TaxID=3002440 RepID=UPI002DBEF753|nr:outer membrane protein transport protein [Flavobacterium sp. SUN046]MEC4049469.1 outer membrane protein transport protein [Flavobacterium sp. SUN046]
MKKILFIAMTCLSVAHSQAQDINDAMRYAQDNLTGTARFRAMGGAFGALGGDLSSLNINPAGSTVFANNQVGITFSNFNTKNDSDYFGRKASDTNNKFSLNQAGAAFVFENSNSDWSKFAIAINYDNTKNLSSNIFSAGTNPTNSIKDYFLSYANGIPLSTVNGNDYYYGDMYYSEQQAYLAYQAYLINPVSNTGTNTQYTSAIPNSGNYYQENAVRNSGYTGKVAFNFATQYKNKLSLGVNLNSHYIDYRQTSSFFESNGYVNPATNNTDYSVKRLRFNNDLYTYGRGFSFNLGAIFKPVKEVRLGLAYESPTWFKLNDELTQSLSSVSGNAGGELNPDTVNPNLTVVFQPYKLQTPGKWTGSFAYVFGKKGLISIDYTMKDYSNTKYAPNSDFSNVNYQMANLLTRTNEVRLGGEYKIKKLSLRGGYRYEQSPYKNGYTIGDLQAYSGGFGFNFGSTKLDLAYTYAKRAFNQQLFSQGLTDSAKINSLNNNVTLTLLFEL